MPFVFAGLIPLPVVCFSSHEASAFWAPMLSL